MFSLKDAVTAWATWAAWAALAQAAPTDNSSESAALSSHAPYVTTSGMSFKVDGGTIYLAGTNAYWIGFLTNNADVDLVMTHLQEAGLKILRVWGFNDVSDTNTDVWYQSFVQGQQPQINTGANGLQRLDYVVSSAEAHDIKLIINFVNNWDAYGGMPLYNSYYGTDTTTWYKSSAVQAQYQTYIKAVVSRYKTSRAVFAWELANEARCHGCDMSVLTDWATSTSAYIKSLDSKHLVSLGDEGWMNGGGDGSSPYSGAEGVDFAANLNIPDLDFGTFHLYPDNWGESDDWGNRWISDHAAACVAAKKPCMLEEYGTQSNHVPVESPWQQTAISSPGIAADLFWQWGDQLSTGKTSDDGNTIYDGSSDYQALVVGHVAEIDGAPPPTSSGTATTTTQTQAQATPTTTPASTGTAPHWGQCGGEGWTGLTVCESPYTCTYENQWYSQCCKLTPRKSSGMACMDTGKI